jgi:hypothetical protein
MIVPHLPYEDSGSQNQYLGRKGIHEVLRWRSVECWLEAIRSTSWLHDSRSPKGACRTDRLGSFDCVSEKERPRTQLIDFLKR